MNAIRRILEHYDRVMQGNPWHGDPIWQVLDGVSAESAARRPLAGAHNIWEIVMHMIFWENVAARRLSGHRAGNDESLNFPPLPQVSEAGWQKTLQEFRNSNRNFRAVLGQLEAGRLDELSAAGERTFYDEAHGLLEHHVYHAGQIALLKKAAEAGVSGR
jgi:uncharacterized damage-inducible protein DinB